MRPGRASTSRLFSRAIRAVIMAPDRRPASTIIVARDSPAMMRLRVGKCSRLGAASIGNSLIQAPWVEISSKSFSCSGG